MRLWIAVSCIALLPVSAFSQEKKDELAPIKVVELNRKDPILYQKDVEPIFFKRCVTCHSGAIKEGKFDVSTYESVVKGGKRGAAVVPGKSENSLLYHSASRAKAPKMPPKGEEPLTPDELAVVKLWIDQGAKAPTGPSIKQKIIVGLPPDNVKPVRAVTVSPNKAAVAASRGNQIHIYDAGSGAYIRSLVDPSLKAPDGKTPVKAAHLSLVEAMAYSPDGKWLVSGSFQEIAIWDIVTGQLRQKIPGFAHLVVGVAFSLDSKFFAVVGGEPTVEGELKVFEVDTWKQVFDLKNGHSDTIYGVCFSPDNKMIATCSADKFVKVWELPGGKFVKSFEGHTHHVLDVGWTSDGKLLASAGGDNTVKVWNFEKGEQERTIAAHAKQVTRLLFIGKKAEFITCGGDNQVKVFNATNGGNVRNFAGANDFIYAVGVSPDGAVVASGGQEGIVRLYNGTSGAFIRNLLPPDAPQPIEEKKK